MAAVVAVAGLGLPLLLGAFGADYFNGRNLIPVFVPLIVLLAAGFAARGARAVGLVLGAALCACALLFAIEIDRLPRLQREDLRNAAAQVGRLQPGTAIISNRYASSQPLRYYLGGHFARRGSLRLREIDLIGSAAAAEGNARHLLSHAFRPVGQEPVSYDDTLTRYRAAHPQQVPVQVLENGALVGGGGRAAVLVAGPN